MTHKERVWAAIHHQQSDCVPKGESWIDGRLANRLMGTDYPTDYQHFEVFNFVLHISYTFGVF